jgi:hypothetical protein
MSAAGVTRTMLTPSLLALVLVAADGGGGGEGGGGRGLHSSTSQLN